MSKSKPKTKYVCTECGASFSKWSGQCGDCLSWNTLSEIIITGPKSSRAIGYAGKNNSEIVHLNEIDTAELPRICSGLSELDRVLGGGLVAGAVILIGGDPGIGKSTLLLQALTSIAKSQSVLYITGEESLQQVKLRAQRLDCDNLDIQLLAETQLEGIINKCEQVKPEVVVVDSIQTLYSEQIPSAAGSVTQVRESTATLVRFAKTSGTAIFLVGHVTKEGAIAGPRVLEHMVDTVIYFESEANNRFRLIRAIKNRFGAANELGIFAMTDKGLKEVSNPSAIFLQRHQANQSGSIIMVTWEGSRPMLVEIQALVDDSHLANPRRLTVGLDLNRLNLILAVINQHAKIFTSNLDIYVNVVGGVKVSETAIDLPTVLAVISSLKKKPLDKNLVCFGEVGLSGELRPVQSGQERLKAAVKLGFNKAVIPAANSPKDAIAGIDIVAMHNIADVISAVF